MLKLRIVNNQESNSPALVFSDNWWNRLCIESVFTLLYVRRWSLCLTLRHQMLHWYSALLSLWNVGCPLSGQPSLECRQSRVGYVLHLYLNVMSMRSCRDRLSVGSLRDVRWSYWATNMCSNSLVGWFSWKISLANGWRFCFVVRQRPENQNLLHSLTSRVMRGGGQYEQRFNNLHVIKY